MTGPNEVYDVVVVGFGPTGATLANLLGRDELHTLVIEREPEVYTLPRALHFDHEVMRIFQSIGMSEKILPWTGPIGGYEFHNADGARIMAFELRDRITSQGWHPDYMFHQPTLERLLREAAEARDTVEVALGRELVGVAEDEEGVTLTVREAADGRERTIRTRALVGCDGASSPTRELAGLAIDDLDFDEPWLVVDATVRRPVEDLGLPTVPFQRCDPARPTTFIPVFHPYVRWEFMLMPGEGVEMQDPERVRERVAEWVDPEEVEVIRSAVYRFHALVGARWRTRRVFVAGDAAHQMPPFLGQGMCAGIRDVDNLAWKLTAVLRGRAADALLDSYQAERAPHVRSVIETAIQLGRIICTTDPEVARARDERLLGGDGGPGGAGGDAPSAAPPLPPLVEGCLDREPRHPLTGHLALQARVRDGEGREGLLDDVVGPGFTLLWNGAPASLGEEARRSLDRLGVKQVSFGEPAETPGALGVEDVDGAYASWFARYDIRAALVRPDHAIFAAVDGSGDPDALLRALADATA